MDRNPRILFSGLLILLLGTNAQAQLKSKTFTESFPVDSQSEVNINTSHADLEFETWDRDQVEVTVLVELEGASEEEAKTYFEKELVKIMGNSREIEISTLGNRPFAFDFRTMDLDFSMVPDLSHMMEDFELPELPEIAPLPEIAMMPKMLAIPPFPFVEFDYGEYQKDKEKYRKKWQQEFEKSFDQEYKEKLEKWGQEMAEKAGKWEQHRERIAEQRLELHKKREQRHGERQRKLGEKMEELHKKREESAKSHTAPNVYYFSLGGESKAYKVKKHIKIKMPKYLKLNLNVRHGEVKLATHARNVHANLRYSTLLASTIGGDLTDIQASYSPISVQNWDYGKLSTDYSDRVNLKVVGDLDLNSNASQVVIGTLVDRAKLQNRFGSLKIGAVSDGFAALDISVENGALDFNLPTSPYVITLRATGSDLKYPKSVELKSSGTSGATVLQGFHINNKGNKAITINSKYSEVVLMD